MHSNIYDANSLFPEFCSELLDAVLRALYWPEVHLRGKNFVDILFANPYDSTRSYNFV